VIAMHGQPPPTTDHQPVPTDDLFEDAYRRCGTAVLGYALRRSVSREDALDVVAETFAIAWRRRTDLPADPQDVRPWLFGIARRCLANVVRSTDRASRLGARLADSFADAGVPDPSTLHENRAESRLVREALDQLSPEDRELVTLIAWEGLTPAQAATVPGLSAGTARVRLHRARTKLRAHSPALHTPRRPTVITERELDAWLAGATDVRDADLPTLPEEFLRLLGAGTEGAMPANAARTESASVIAARQLVSDARDARTAPRPRRRRPGRTAVLRSGLAVVAVAAAAWATAVVVVGPETAGPPPGAVTLVDFDMPAFPLTLPTAPPGTSGPVFGGSGGGGASMSYVSPESPVDSVNLHVGTEPPPVVSDGFSGSVVEDTVTIHGRPGRLTVMTTESDDFRIAYLHWERVPGQWVTVFGQGRFAEGDLMTALAEDLVDSPQTVPLQLHLAPAGWSLDFFKDNGRIVRLADDADPEQGLTVHVPFPDEVVPADQLPGMVERAVGPVEEVIVQGQLAQLVPADQGGGEQGWYLQARFPDGTTFVVQAPGALTREQVVKIAEQVTYTP
jgi:RNA polymerase sigma factor (sigma-70 family)